MDTNSSDASGSYSYVISLIAGADGDMDTDMDGDSLQESDTDSDGDSEIENEEEAQPVILTASFSFGIRADDAFTNPFTDLTCKAGTGEVYIYSDDGFGIIQYDDTSESPFKGNEIVYQTSTFKSRGAAFDGASEPAVLKIYPKGEISPTTEGTSISLPVAMGAEPSGLAYLNGKFYVSEKNNKELYIFSYSEANDWTSEVVSFPDFTSFEGVAAAGDFIYILDTNSGENQSNIHRMNPFGYELSTHYTITNQLSGIAYNPKNKQMMGSIIGVNAFVSMSPLDAKAGEEWDAVLE